MTGNELRSWCLARPVPQAEIADLMGVPVRRLRKYMEKGDDPIPATAAERIAALTTPAGPWKTARPDPGPKVPPTPRPRPRPPLDVLRADEALEVAAPDTGDVDKLDPDPRATSARLAGWARRHRLTVPVLAAVLEVEGATAARWIRGPVVRLPRRVADRIRHLDPTGRLG